jgi:cell division septum initiation protein DivIVA
MNKKLDDLSKEFDKDKSIVIRREVSLYLSSISSATAAFLREVDQQSKKMKQSNLTLVAILREVPTTNY